MNNGNYIKLCRSLLNWEWYGDINTARVFIHCLLKANWRAGRFEGVDVPRGSFITSLPKLSKEVGLSERQVRTALEHLKSTGELTVNSTNKYRVITVNNYCQYQDDDRQADSQATGKRQANDRQTTAIEEYKESKKGKNIDSSINNNSIKSVGKSIPPTVEEVRAYCDEKGYRIDPERFVDYYTSNGWMVGKNKMKDWTAAVRTWNKQDNPQKKKGGDDGFKLFD